MRKTRGICRLVIGLTLSLSHLAFADVSPYKRLNGEFAFGQPVSFEELRTAYNFKKGRCFTENDTLESGRDARIEFRKIENGPLFPKIDAVFLAFSASNYSPMYQNPKLGEEGLILENASQEEAGQWLVRVTDGRIYAKSSGVQIGTSMINFMCYFYDQM